MMRKRMAGWERPVGLLLVGLLFYAGSLAAQPSPQAPGRGTPPATLQQTIRDSVQQALEQVQEAQAGQTPALPSPPAKSNQLTPDQQYEIAREALRYGGPGTLALLAPFGFFGMIVLIVWLGTRRRQAQIQAQAQLRKQLIDKFGTGPELASFLESKGGQQFFADMQHAGSPLRFLPSGIVISMIGLAFLGLTLVHRPFIIPGVILLAIGVGLLLSAAIGHKLMAKRNGDPIGQASGPGMASLPRP